MSKNFIKLKAEDLKPKTMLKVVDVMIMNH
jgi:hypothetical protein